MITNLDPREHRIFANNLTHHVLEWNVSDSDTTVVLIHGLLDLAWSFELVAQKLASRYHIIAPDLRGHGDTDWVGLGGYYYIPDYTADLARLLPALTRKRVFVVGHSLGGVISTFYTGTFPERVQKLAVLEGIGPPDMRPEHAPERLLEHIRTVDEARAKTVRPLDSIDAAAERLKELYPKLDAQWVQRLAEKSTRQAPNGASGNRVWKYDPMHRTRTPILFNLPQFEAFARRIACPILLVDGLESDLKFTHDPQRKAIYPNRQERALTGAGHMMQLDQPEALTDLLFEFFQ